MSLTEKDLEERISHRIEGVEHVQVIDISGGCGAVGSPAFPQSSSSDDDQLGAQSFQCTIVSSAFQGKNTLSRNRIVFKALKEELELIHAFTQTNYTPAQWSEKQAASSRPDDQAKSSSTIETKDAINSDSATIAQTS